MPLAMGVTAGVVGVVLTPVVVSAGLGAVGFSAAGPVAGKFPSPLALSITVMRQPIFSGQPQAR
jgi:hypothetical protein